MMTSKDPTSKSHRQSDVGTSIVNVCSVRFGDGSYPVIVGPMAVENEKQILTVAEAAAESGAAALRAGTFRAEVSPYAFRGLGEEGLGLLERAGREVGLPTVTEVLEPGHVDLIANHVDLLEVGPDNMQNFVLLRAVGGSGKPIMLHRGPSATIDEWLMATEYILAEDNDQVILCERGSRSFDPRTSDTIDISVIPVVQRLSHLPVVIDPAPVEDAPDILQPLALAGRGVGADGLVVSVHPDPGTALAGNGNQLDLPAFGRLMDALGIPLLRGEIDYIDRQLIKLLSDRLQSSVDIARIKTQRGLSLRSPLREAELIEEARVDAEAFGLDPQYIDDLMTLVLEYSRAAQRKAVGNGQDIEG